MDMTPEEILDKHAVRVMYGANGKEQVLAAMREYGELKQSPRWVKAEEPKEKGRYFVRYRSEWDGGVINACVVWDKFWHIRKGDTIVEWLDESESPGSQEAVEFAEWAASLYRKIDKDDEGNQWIENLLGRYYTSEELYTLFKQTK